jgi:hypothetical protein
MQFYVILEERFKGTGPSCKISQKKILWPGLLALYERIPSGVGGKQGPLYDDYIKKTRAEGGST